MESLEQIKVRAEAAMPGAKIDSQKLTGTDKAEHLDPTQLSEFPVPAFGAHDLEPPANPDVFHPLKIERQS